MVGICFLKGPSLVSSTMVLFAVFDVSGAFPVVADGSSLLGCSLSLTSTPPPSFTPVRRFSPHILAFSKLCTVGLGMGTFPDMTIFDDFCFFFELLPVQGELVLKGPLFAVKSDFLSTEATCLLILGTLLSHSTLTKPNQYDAAWLMRILGMSVLIT